MDRIHYGGQWIVLLGLYTDHAQCWNVGCRLQLKCDGAREERWRGNWRMEWVGSTLHTTSEHGVSSITTADAHTSAASSRLNWRPSRFKWTRPFRRKTQCGFCACAITFQLASTIAGFIRQRKGSLQRITLTPSAFSATGCLFIGSTITAVDTAFFFFFSYETCIRPECGARLRSAVQLNLISY